MNREALPLIIQDGMGVAVSDWRLARAVALCGQLGPYTSVSGGGPGRGSSGGTTALLR